MKDNRFQQLLVSLFQKRKLTLANLKTVKENLILLMNGGMTLESFLGQKLLMPEKLSSNDFELKVKNLELPFRDFVEGLKNGSLQPKKLGRKILETCNKTNIMFFTCKLAHLGFLKRPQKGARMAPRWSSTHPHNLYIQTINGNFA